MPQLPEYESKAADSGLRTNNIGMEARAQEGRRIGAFGQQERNDVDQLGATVGSVANQWEEHLTFQQMGNAISATATNHNQQMQAFSQILKDPSVDKADPTILKQVMDGYDASQEAISKTLTTQKGQDWYLEAKARDRDAFQTAAIGQLSQYAGIQQHNNLLNATNQQGALVNHDPTQVTTALDTIEHNYEGMSSTATIDAETGKAIPALTRADQTAVALQGAEGSIAKSAQKLIDDATLSGATSIDPDAAKAAVQGGLDHYMGSDPRLAGLIGDKAGEYGEKVEAAAASAVRQVRAGDLQRKQQLEDQGNADYAKILDAVNTSVRAGKAPGPDVVAAVHQYADKYGSVGALAGHLDVLEHSINSSIEDANSRKFQQSDSATYQAYQAGITTPEGQPGYVSDVALGQAAYGPHPTLSIPDYNNLVAQRKLISDNPQVREGLDGISSWLKDNAPRLTRGAAAGATLDANGQLNLATAGASTFDKDGDHALGVATREMKARYMADVQSGTAPLTAADNLTNPSSRAYFGYRYQQIIDAKKKGQAGGPSIDTWETQNPYGQQTPRPPAAAPPKPGEGIGDWYARTHGGH